MASVETYHAIKVDKEKCFGCTHCMKACPTQAIRVKQGKAQITSERCVDCGNCLRVCPAKAFYVEQDDLNKIKEYKNRIVIFPSVMVGQFPEKYSDDQIYSAILKLGFTHIYEVEQPIQVLIESIKDLYNNENKKPLISSFCPAIVKLIRIKYPSLAQNIVNLKVPHDLVSSFIIRKLKNEGLEWSETGIFYVSPCSAKFGAVKKQMNSENPLVHGIINMKDFYNLVMQQIGPSRKAETKNFREYLANEGILWSLTRGEARLFKSNAMAIDGIHNVIKFLEKIENEELPGLKYLDFKSCDQGCAGGILLTGNRFLTVERLKKRAMRYPKSENLKIKGIDLTSLKQSLVSEPFVPNYVFALDADRKTAIEKLDKKHKIRALLPSVDCGGCGAPNCSALAEDIVQGKAKFTDCVFIQNHKLNSSNLKTTKTPADQSEIWGENRFKLLNKKNIL